MEHRSWLWRRRSSGKSPGETDSSGSLSSHSERCSDDQEALRASPIDVSPDHTQSPEVSSNIAHCEVQESVKSLNEKISAAFLKIKDKEDLAKQHAKVAEEAVSGWEMSETEVADLKQQLDAAAQKNSALEDRIDHLDGALKECVRQLRRSREEQDQKVQDELESRLGELHALEKENFALKVELLTRSQDLQQQTLERELSTRAAEAASKQHLESKKKVAKLKAECHRLKTAACKSLVINDGKSLANSVCLESLTDSQSNSEPSWSDSWASPLIPEHDRLMNENILKKNLTATSIEIDLMDDFLEMERLAALPEADRGSSNFDLHADSDRRKMAELEEKVEKMTNEKAEMMMALAKTQNQLVVGEDRLVELQRHLNSANASKHIFEVEVEAVEAKRKELEYQLKSANLEVEEEKALHAEFAAKCQDLESLVGSVNLEFEKLRDKVGSLERKVEEERASLSEFAAKCRNLESAEAKRIELESRLDSAQLEVGELHEKLSLLEVRVNEERALSAELAANVAAVEATKKALESELESAQLEVARLSQKVDLFERKAEEGELSAKYAGGYQNLEDELPRRKPEAELRRPTSSNGELKINQEKEPDLAAGKLAECQKTIASLGRQLKSLATFEDFMLEDEKREHSQETSQSTNPLVNIVTSKEERKSSPSCSSSS